jgi:hypothetical protein
MSSDAKIIMAPNHPQLSVRLSIIPQAAHVFSFSQC